MSTITVFGSLLTVISNSVLDDDAADGTYSEGGKTGELPLPPPSFGDGMGGVGGVGGGGGA